MKFGAFELFLVCDGKFRLDGGAMFGVVPKVLWNRLNPADELNRIQLGLNCLLIKTGGDLILVDTGIGSNYDAKFADMFAIERPEGLLGGLQHLGFQAEDVTKVILTHLHFDHCGGNCVVEDGRPRPAFPKATYYVQKGEFEYAQHPDPRSRGSYLAKNWQCVQESGQLAFLEGDGEVVPGVEVQVTGGHTRDHQIVKVRSGDRTACFLADLVPTDAHLKTAYVMGYDLYPKTTMEVKERVLRQALQEKWLLVFEHAPEVTAGYLYEADGKLAVERVGI